jgi:hypothetical protein
MVQAAIESASRCRPLRYPHFAERMSKPVRWAFGYRWCLGDIAYSTKELTLCLDLAADSAMQRCTAPDVTVDDIDELIHCAVQLRAAASRVRVEASE